MLIGTRKPRHRHPREGDAYIHPCCADLYNVDTVVSAYIKLNCNRTTAPSNGCHEIPH